MTDILLIVPHPDDEVFGVGGLLARTAASGRTVATLTLTRGRAGRTLGLCSQEELPALREQELRGSLAALGVEDVTVLDHLAVSRRCRPLGSSPRSEQRSNGPPRG
jgi:LmbE family N-acetylglucosaminyl deacetylase